MWYANIITFCLFFHTQHKDVHWEGRKGCCIVWTMTCWRCALEGDHYLLGIGRKLGHCVHIPIVIYSGFGLTKLGSIEILNQGLLNFPFCIFFKWHGILSCFVMYQPTKRLHFNCRCGWFAPCLFFFSAIYPAIYLTVLVSNSTIILFVLDQNIYVLLLQLLCPSLATG